MAGKRRSHSFYLFAAPVPSDPPGGSSYHPYCVRYTSSTDIDQGTNPYDRPLEDVNPQGRRGKSPPSSSSRAFQDYDR